MLLRALFSSLGVGNIFQDDLPKSVNLRIFQVQVLLAIKGITARYINTQYFYHCRRWSLAYFVLLFSCFLPKQD